MEIIHHNPYRIAGILSGVSERELQKQKGKITKYISIGKEVTSEFDFNVLDNINRSEDSINKAFSEIEQNQDKVNNSIFWFLINNPIDETAINYLKDGNKEKALEIWGKITIGKEVSEKNFSAFNNFGTLKLISDSVVDIKEGIESKIKLIESSSFKNFVHTVADQTFTIDSKKQSEDFIDRLLKQLKNKYSSSDSLNLFSGCNSNTQKYLSLKFTEEPIHSIENNIETTKSKRKKSVCDAYEFGLHLFVKTKDDHSLLKTLLGESNIQYKLLADTLAKEIMQCGIDYFNELKNTKDPSEEALKLLKYAQFIAVGTQTKERVKENIAGIKEWAESAPIQEDLTAITKQLVLFQDQNHTVNNVAAFIRNCKVKLQNIKSILGVEDDYYLDISSTVVNNALGALISIVNEAQSGLEHNREKLFALPVLMENAVTVMNSIGTLDMSSKTLTRYSENKTTIKGINSQLEVFRRQSNTVSKSSSSSGCYIATMAYGDYNHPQVIELRTFRDGYLSRNILGRTFIKIYYKYSPSLVEMLKDKKIFNQFIRSLLDTFIKIIKKK